MLTDIDISNIIFQEEDKSKNSFSQTSILESPLTFVIRHRNFQFERTKEIEITETDRHVLDDCHTRIVWNDFPTESHRNPMTLSSDSREKAMTCNSCMSVDVFCQDNEGN